MRKLFFGGILQHGGAAGLVLLSGWFMSISLLAEYPMSNKESPISTLRGRRQGAVQWAVRMWVSVREVLALGTV